MVVYGNTFYCDVSVCNFYGMYVCTVGRNYTPHSIRVLCHPVDRLHSAGKKPGIYVGRDAGANYLRLVISQTPVPTCATK